MGVGQVCGGLARREYRFALRNRIIDRMHRAKIDPTGSPDGVTSAPRLPDWQFLLLAAGIVAGAFLLRAHEIGKQEIWLDEAASFQRAITGQTSNNMVLYYLLLRGWVAIAGQSEAGLRSLSAISGALFVLVVIWAGRTFLEWRAGLWGGLIAAVNPIHIYYSQEARGYALLTLFLLLAYLMLWRALERDTWPSWGLFSACVLAALYTHNLAVLAVFPTVFLVLLWPKGERRKERWLRYCGAMLFSGLLFVPWILSKIAGRPDPVVVSSWVRMAWETTSPALAIPRTLEVFGLGGEAGLVLIRMKQYTTLEIPGSLRLLGLVVLVFLGIWVAFPWGDKALGVPWLGRRKAWLAAPLLFPLVALWGISFYKPLYLVGRYDMVAFPTYPILLGLALSKLHRVRRVGPALAALAAGLLLVPIGMKLSLYYQAPSEGDARATARALHEIVMDGDVLIFTGLRGLPVLYYMNSLGYRWEGGYCRSEISKRRFACRMYPRETEQRPAVFNLNLSLKPADAVRDDVQEYLTALRPQGGSVWVAFERGRFSEGVLILPDVDALLAGELVRHGLKPVPLQGPQRVFRFRRPG